MHTIEQRKRTSNKYNLERDIEKDEGIQDTTQQLRGSEVGYRDLGNGYFEEVDGNVTTTAERTQEK